MLMDMDSFSSRSVAFIALASGVLWAQVDTATPRKDSVATAVLSASDSLKAQASPVPVVDTAKPVVLDTAVKPASSPSPAIVVDSAKKTDEAASMVAEAAPSCAGRWNWALEVGGGYDWVLGELVDKEDDLVRRFRVVLTDEENDSSAVNPIGSGFVARATLWRKSVSGNQFGLGVAYGNFRQHPASSYSASLTEDFFTELQVSLRYRRSMPLTSSIGWHGEAAVGWTNLSLLRASLVAAHREDGLLTLSSEEKKQVQALHREVDANGIRGEALVGLDLQLAPAWSLGFQLGAAYGQVWLSETAAIDAVVGYPDNLGYVSLGAGLSVTRDF